MIWAIKQKGKDQFFIGFLPSKQGRKNPPPRLVFPAFRKFSIKTILFGTKREAAQHIEREWLSDCEPVKLKVSW